MALSPKFTKPDSCTGCDLYGRGLGYAPADGPVGARLTFLAEALGAQEVIAGRPLVGAAGGVHTRVLARAGIPRDVTRADNCVRCMPTGMWFDEKAPWYYPALTHCAQYRGQTLAAIPQDGVLVTYGAVALRTALDLHGVAGINVRDFHGTVTRDPSNRYWIVPTFHPSHLQRGAMNLLEVVTQDLRLAARVAQQGFIRSRYTLIVDPTPEFVRAWIADHLTRLTADPERVWLALDTEYAEKISGQDESEVILTDSLITRVNISDRVDIGVSFPYTEPYRALLEQLMVATGQLDGFIWYWNKYADVDHLVNAGHTITGLGHVDLMWLTHYLQSDLPRGLGFWAPFASDAGPWKHWGQVEARQGEYAAMDGLQTFRVAVWAVQQAHDARVWPVFWRDWHERDTYVLRPSREVGVPADRPALVAFHADLQQKATRVLGEIQRVGADGTLRPKQGYAKKPRAGADGVITPPKSILGGGKGKRPNEAKQAYVTDHVELVERVILVDQRCCRTCGAVAVGVKHRCGGVKKAAVNPAVLTIEAISSTRWFWRLPFNPASWQQILAYIGQAGHTAGESKKTRKPTTDAASLKILAAQTGDPLYQLILDLRAVTKVDSTYAVSVLDKLDDDDRIHPEIHPKPSTLRDSSSGPNLQNVVSDKGASAGGTAALAAGFRKCIVARDGLPAWLDDDEYHAWQSRWCVDA